jgi:hypothetical protein
MLQGEAPCAIAQLYTQVGPFDQRSNPFRQRVHIAMGHKKTGLPLDDAIAEAG